MNKRFVIIAIAAIMTYMVYGYLNQKAKDDEFASACISGTNLTTLSFILPEQKKIKKLHLKISRANQKTIMEVATQHSGNNNFSYTGGFSSLDTLEITSLSKKYKMYGFKYVSIVINAKKGPECQYRGAYINGKWNDGNIVSLED